MGFQKFVGLEGLSLCFYFVGCTDNYVVFVNFEFHRLILLFGSFFGSGF